MRNHLRAFRAMRGDPPDPAFVADLEYLENRDLDLSVRLGALLAFNALMATIGTHPISASPGAPLSLDAATQPLEVIATFVSLAPFLVSSALCLSAMLLGEEFESDGAAEHEGLRLRLFSAFVASIDHQARNLRRAVIASVAGGVLTLALWVVIILEKMG